MGQLQDEMIRYMKVRGYSSKTIQIYTSSVRALANYFHKSPLFITSREIEDYFFYLRDMNKADATIRLYYEALKFFYRTKGIADRVPVLHFKKERARRLLVLNSNEIRKLLSAFRSLKYQAIFSLIYSSGLRISEALNLRKDDIDFQRKLIYVRSGKNGKDRRTILANSAVVILMKYLMLYQPTDRLFYSTDRETSLSQDTVRRALKRILGELNLNPSITIHTFRHSFATHLIEKGTSIFHVMNLLGHANIQTTMIYLHMQSPESLGIVSPLDSIGDMSEGQTQRELNFTSMISA